jgi:hypothetical protein
VDNASRFDQPAAEESNPVLKAHFAQEAIACRDLAAVRAEKLGLAAPGRDQVEEKAAIAK